MLLQLQQGFVRCMVPSISATTPLQQDSFLFFFFFADKGSGKQRIAHAVWIDLKCANEGIRAQ